PLPWRGHDPSPHRRAAGRGRLALRARDRRRQARAADQQLPPPARRGNFRRVRPAADRVTLEELPDDGPRGDRRGQDRLRVLEEVVHTSRVSRVLLGVSGGIAAYKACELTRALVRAGHDVIPLVTKGAEEFVSARTFPAPARRPAGEDLYPHLTSADLLVVAPCTANTLAKLAHGIADNVLTEAALAHRGPILVAPAMNPRMWANAATQANVELLRRRGVEFVGP